MSAQHTPGPLHVVEVEAPRQYRIESKYGQNKGEWDDIYVHFSGFFGSYGPNMFAAAPEMLAALRDCLRFLEHDYRGGYSEPEKAKARAAIAKATGEKV
jgi:hypothetical protein